MNSNPQSNPPPNIWNPPSNPSQNVAPVEQNYYPLPPAPENSVSQLIPQGILQQNDPRAPPTNSIKPASHAGPKPVNPKKPLPPYPQAPSLNNPGVSQSSNIKPGNQPVLLGPGTPPQKNPPPAQGNPAPPQKNPAPHQGNPAPSHGKPPTHSHGNPTQGIPPPQPSYPQAPPLNFPQVSQSSNVNPANQPVLLGSGAPPHGNPPTYQGNPPPQNVVRPVVNRPANQHGSQQAQQIQTIPGIVNQQNVVNDKIYERRQESKPNTSSF